MGFQHGSIRNTTDPVDVVDLHTVDYLETWRHQADLARRRAADKIPDTLLLLSLIHISEPTRPY